MINRFGTGKPTEADGERGSGRKRRQLFGRRRLSSPAWRAASGAKPHPSTGKMLAVVVLLLFCCSAGHSSRSHRSTPHGALASGAKPPPSTGKMLAGVVLLFCCSAGLSSRRIFLRQSPTAIAAEAPSRGQAPPHSPQSSNCRLSS